MMDSLISLILVIAIGPGYWLPMLVDRIKSRGLGDGTGNESGMLEGMIWAIFGALITWGAVVSLIVWLCMHLKWT